MLPYSSYVAEPRTPLHAIDARVKEAWVISLLLLVARAGSEASLCIAAGVPLAACLTSSSCESTCLSVQ